MMNSEMMGNSSMIGTMRLHDGLEDMGATIPRHDPEQMQQHCLLMDRVRPKGGR
jgi:hypothetical protein